MPVIFPVPLLHPSLSTLRSHGGMHSRAENFCKSQGWRFAPVQFKDAERKADWKRLWKLQVEEFACNTVAEGKVKVRGLGGPLALPWHFLSLDSELHALP